MKYQVRYSRTFQKGLKKLKNNQGILEHTEAIILKLANDESLEPNYKDYKLSGEYEGFRECHIKTNGIYKASKENPLFKKLESSLHAFCHCRSLLLVIIPT